MFHAVDEGWSNEYFLPIYVRVFSQVSGQQSWKDFLLSTGPATACAHVSPVSAQVIHRLGAAGGGLMPDLPATVMAMDFFAFINGFLAWSQTPLGANVVGPLVVVLATATGIFLV